MNALSRVLEFSRFILHSQGISPVKNRLLLLNATASRCALSLRNAVGRRHISCRIHTPQAGRDGALLRRLVAGSLFSGMGAIGWCWYKSVGASSIIDDKGKLDSKRWNFIADVVDLAAPAVVYIEIQQRHPFTGRNVAASNGSGFIVREDGLILTNAHVIGNSATVKVKLHDGRTVDGVVQAVDRVSDLATVKISAGGGLPVMKLGDSTQLRPGEWVVAMGSPFQLSNTVTAGIVSSVQRGSKELGLHNNNINYIQTDATINFGNSGGPLVNLDGEAIGINTMMVTSGISFAIPSNYAQNFLTKAEVIEKRSTEKSKKSPAAIQRGYIGVTMLSLTPDILRTVKQRTTGFPDVDHGVLIHKVMLGSPAYSAGMRPGDVITRINEREIREASDVYAVIEDTKVLSVTLRRGESTLVVSVTPEHPAS